jgi:hypothetical protein
MFIFFLRLHMYIAIAFGNEPVVHIVHRYRRAVYRPRARLFVVFEKSENHLSRVFSFERNDVRPGHV